MPQGVLPFQYAAERSSTGMTAMAGAGVYLDMVAAAGLWESVRRHVGIKGMSQGWTDIQMITSLVLLNVAGGESVSDLNVLEGDEGLGVCCEGWRLMGCAVASVRQWSRGGGSGVSAVYHRHRRCSDTWTSSMTLGRRLSESPAGRSYLRRLRVCVG